MVSKDKRLQELTRYTDREKLGIEIAPFFNPAVPKADGYNVLVVDISPTHVLRKRAVSSDHIPAHRAHEIEDVDIIGDASQLSELLKKAQITSEIHYIVSSHNFEHLPNPIKFLTGCADVLAEGGVLSMAIPDYRACFDHFRYPTRLSDWMRAYRQDISAPDPDTILDYVMNKSTYQDEFGSQQSCSLQTAAPGLFVADRQVDKAYDLYLEHLKPDSDYADVHCTVSFGATFELMVRDLIHFRLLDLEVIDVTETVGHEYFVHLRKSSPRETSLEGYYARRSELLAEIDCGLGPLGFDQVRQGRLLGYIQPQQGAGAVFRRIGIFVLGPKRVSAIRVWNRKRRQLRKDARRRSSV